MTEEDLAMIKWLKNASPEEVLAEMKAVEKELFRKPKDIKGETN